MSKNIANSIYYLLPTAISGLLPFVTLPIFTRILTPSDYGVLALSQAYAIFMVGISNFGLTFGYERNFFEFDDPKRTSGLLYSSLIFVTIVFLLIGILTILFSNNISQFLFEHPNNSLFISVTYFAIGVSSLKTYFITYFKNTENPKSYIFYVLNESISIFILSIAFIVFFKTGVIGIVLAQLISGIYVLTLLLNRFLKILPFSLDSKAFKDSLNISLPLTPRIFFGVIGSQFDKYIIGIVSTIGSLGIYSIAQRLSSLIFVFMTAIQNVWGPVIYKMMFDKKMVDSNKKIGQFLFPFFYVSIFFGLIISVFSVEIVYIVAPKEYSPAAEMITILAILQCTFFFQKQNQLIFAKKTYLISALTLLGISLNISINWFFVNYWGAIGVAWGSLLSGILIGLISFYFSQKSFRIVFKKNSFGVVFLIYVLSSFVAISLMHISLDYIYELAIKIILLLIFVYSGFFTGVINKSTFNNLRKSLINKLKN